MFLLSCLALSSSACGMKPLQVPQSHGTSPAVSREWQNQNDWHEKQQDGDYFLFVQRFDRAEAAFDEAIAKAVEAGFRDARVARSYTGLARARVGRRKYAEALADYRNALQIKKRSYGNFSADVGDILTEMAYLHILLNQPVEARKLVLESFQIWKKLKAEHITELVFVDGALTWQEGNDKSAGAKLERAASQYIEQTDLKRYPQSTHSLRMARDCGERYATWLLVHGKKSEAQLLRERFKPINEWLMILGESGA